MRLSMDQVHAIIEKSYRTESATDEDKQALWDTIRDINDSIHSLDQTLHQCIISLRQWDPESCETPYQSWYSYIFALQYIEQLLIKMEDSYAKRLPYNN